MQASRRVHDALLTLSLDDTMNIEKERVFHACTTLTRSMERAADTRSFQENSKIHADEIAYICIRFIQSRLFSSKRHPENVAHLPHSANELRMLVRVILAAADVHRRAGERASNSRSGVELPTDEGEPAREMSGSATMVSSAGASVFEVYRRKLIHMLSSELRTFFIAYQNEKEKIPSLCNCTFLVACIEVWCFYGQCSPLDVSSIEQDERTGLSNKVQMNITAHVLVVLLSVARRYQDGEEGQDHHIDAWKTFSISLYRIVASLFGAGSTFLKPFFMKLNVKGPMCIVELFRNIPEELRYGNANVIAASTSFCIQIIQERGRVSWDKLIRLCFEVDVRGMEYKLYQMSAPAVESVLKAFLMFQKNDNESRVLCDAYAMAILKCFRWKTTVNRHCHELFRKGIAVYLKKSSNLLKAILNLPWQPKHQQMLWNSLVQLDILQADMQKENFDMQSMVEFYDSFGTIKLHRQCAFRAASFSNFPQMTIVDVAKGSRPNWGNLARMGIMAWGYFTEQHANRRKITCGLPGAGVVQLACALRAVLATELGKYNEARDWVHAAFVTAPLVLGYVREASNKGAGLHRDIMICVKHSISATLLLWTCSSIFDTCHSASKRMRHHLTLMGRYAAKSGQLVLHQWQNAHSHVQVNSPPVLFSIRTLLGHLCRAVELRPPSRENATTAYDTLVSKIEIFKVDQRRLACDIDDDTKETRGHIFSTVQQSECGVMTADFAIRLVQSTAQRFDATSLHTHCALHLFHEAARVTMETQSDGHPSHTLIAEVCARVLREYPRTSPQVDTAFQVLQCMARTGRSSLVRRMLVSIFGLPTPTRSSWTGPVPNYYIENLLRNAVDVRRNDETVHFVRKSISDAYHKGVSSSSPTYTSLRICLAYIMVHRHFGIIPECTHEEKANKKISVYQWAVESCIESQDVGGATRNVRSTPPEQEERMPFSTMCCWCPNDTKQPPKTKAAFFSKCDFLSASGFCSSPRTFSPSDVMAWIGLEDRAVYTSWIREYVHQVSALENENSLLLAFCLWHDLDGIEQHTETHAVLAHALLPLLTRPSIPQSTAIYVKQDCVETLSPLAHSLIDPWKVRIVVAKWMSVRCPNAFLAIGVQMLLLFSTEDVSGENETYDAINSSIKASVSNIKRSPGPGTLRTENGLVNAAYVLACYAPVVLKSCRPRLCRAWIRAAAELSCDVSSVKTGNQIRYVTLKLFQRFLIPRVHMRHAQSPPSEENDFKCIGFMSSEWWRSSHHIESITRDVMIIFSANNTRGFSILKGIIRKQCIKAWGGDYTRAAGKLKNDHTWMYAHSSLRAYTAWSATVPMGVSLSLKDKNTCAAFQSLRDTCLWIQKNASIRNLGLVRRTMDSKAFASFQKLIQQVVRDAIGRKWETRDEMKHASTCLAIILSHRSTAPFAWSGIAEYLSEGHLDSKSVLFYIIQQPEAIKVVRRGLLPVDRSAGQDRLDLKTEAERGAQFVNILTVLSSTLSQKQMFGNAEESHSKPTVLAFLHALVDIALSPEWEHTRVYKKSFWSIRNRGKELLGRLVQHETSFFGNALFERRASMEDTEWFFQSLRAFLQFKHTDRDEKKAKSWQASDSDWLWMAKYEMRIGKRRPLLVLNQWSAWFCSYVSGSCIDQREAMIINFLSTFFDGQSETRFSIVQCIFAQALLHCTLNTPIALSTHSYTLDHRLADFMDVCTARVPLPGLHCLINELGKRLEERLLTRNARRAAFSHEEGCTRGEKTELHLGRILEARCLSILRAGYPREFLCESLQALHRHLNGHFQACLDSVLDADYKGAIEHFVTGLTQARLDMRKSERAESDINTETPGDLIPRILTLPLVETIARVISSRSSTADQLIIDSLLRGLGLLPQCEPEARVRERRIKVIRRAKAIIRESLRIVSSVSFEGNVNGSDAQKTVTAPQTMRLTTPLKPIFVQNESTGATLSGEEKKNRVCAETFDMYVITYMRAICAVTLCWSSECGGVAKELKWGSNEFVCLSSVLKSIPKAIRRLCKAYVRLDQEELQCAHACANLADMLVRALRCPGMRAQKQCEYIAHMLTSPHRRHLLRKRAVNTFLRTPDLNQSLQEGSLPFHRFFDSRSINMFARGVRFLLLSIVEISRACGHRKLPTIHDACPVGTSALMAVKEWGGIDGSGFSAAHHRHQVLSGTCAKHTWSPQISATGARDAFACEQQFQACAMSTHAHGSPALELLKGIYYGIPKSTTMHIRKAFLMFSLMKSGTAKDRTLLSDEDLSDLLLLGSEILFEHRLATCTVWDIAGRSRARQCIAWHYLRSLIEWASSTAAITELVEDDETCDSPFSDVAVARVLAATLAVQMSTNIFWTAGALEAASSLKPFYIAHSSPAASAMGAALGAALSNSPTERGIVQNLLSNTTRESRMSIRPLARRAVRAAYRVALPPDVDASHIHDRSAPFFFSRLDELFPPTREETEAFGIFQDTERIVSQLAYNIIRPEHALSLQKRVSSLDVTITKDLKSCISRLQTWLLKFSGNGSASSLPKVIIVTDRQAEHGKDVCTEVCRTSISCLKQKCLESLQNQIDQHVQALNRILKKDECAISLEHQGTLQTFVVQNICGGRSTAFRHPDLSVPWIQRAYRLYDVTLQSVTRNGQVRQQNFCMTLHWGQPQQPHWHAIPGENQVSGSLAVLNMLSTVAGYEAFAHHSDAQCVASGGLGKGPRDSAASALRGSTFCAHIVLQSQRSINILPASEAEVRFTLAHILSGQLNGDDDCAYINRATIDAEKCRYGISTSDILKRVPMMGKRCLAESAAPWFATFGGSTRMYSDTSWPSLVLNTRLGIFEFPNIQSIAGRHVEKCTWGKMIREVFDDLECEAYLIPAVRYYRHIFLVNRDDVCITEALSNLCSGKSFIECLCDLDVHYSNIEALWTPLSSKARAHVYETARDDDEKKDGMGSRQRGIRMEDTRQYIKNLLDLSDASDAAATERKRCHDTSNDWIRARVQMEKILKHHTSHCAALPSVVHDSKNEEERKKLSASSTERRAASKRRSHKARRKRPRKRRRTQKK